MPVQFLAPEISVREELNALQGLKDRSVDPGYGTPIGGGETLWGDGSITGSNSNGSYTKWPNGDLIIIGVFGAGHPASSTVSGVSSYQKTVPYAPVEGDVGTPTLDRNHSTWDVVIKREIYANTSTGSVIIYADSASTLAHNYSYSYTGKWK